MCTTLLGDLSAAVHRPARLAPMSLTLLPAVDVVDGKAVRLHQGAAGSEKVYGTPLEAALNWQEQGAQWLHFVDLDAAFNRGSNYQLSGRRVVGALDINVELTGGIRDDAPWSVHWPRRAAREYRHRSVGES